MRLYSNSDAIVNGCYDYDLIVQYRKSHARKRFDYYEIARANAHKQKMLITFTYNDPSPLFKMQVINDMRNHFNKLLRNLNNPQIVFFSNIELGSKFDNPHVHIQVWYNNDADRHDISKIYDKVVSRYGLCSNRCVVSYDDRNTDIFHYVIKDYAKSLTNEEVHLIESWKRFYRVELGKNIRYTSHTSHSHSKDLYRKAYKLGIRKYDLDYLIAAGIIDNKLILVDDRIAYMALWMGVLRYLVQNNNKMIGDCDCCFCGSFFHYFKFNYWIFGFLDKYP